MSENTKLLTALVTGYLECKLPKSETLDQIKTELNTFHNFPVEIIDIFNDLIQKFDLRQLNELFELLDYLTYYSPERIKQLLRNKHFIEKISSLAMESIVQDKTLSLLKIWHDKFLDSKSKLSELYELIELIQSIGVMLPINPELTYCGQSSTSNVRKEKNKIVEEYKIQDGFIGPLMPGDNKRDLEKIDSQVNILLKSMEKTKEKDFLLKNNDEKLIIIDKYLNEAQELLNKTITLAADNMDDNKVYSLNNLIKKIVNIQESLNKDMDMIKSMQTLQSTNSIIQPPNLENLLYNQVRANNICDIIQPISKGQSRLSNKFVLSWDRLARYKTEECSYGINCKLLPHYKRGIRFVNDDYVCDKWHYRYGDRRRDIASKNTNQPFNYLDTRCPHRRKCPERDKCRFSHTIFEYLFHPNQYKRYRCANNIECNKKNYCPFWHTHEEELIWTDLLKTRFNIYRSVGTSQSSEPDPDFPFDIDVEEFIYNNMETRLSDNDENIINLQKSSGLRENLKNSIQYDQAINNKPNDIIVEEINNEENLLTNLNKTLTCIEIKRIANTQLNNFTRQFENYEFFVDKIKKSKDLEFKDELSNIPCLLALSEKYDLSKINLQTDRISNGNNNGNSP